MQCYCDWVLILIQILIIACQGYVSSKFGHLVTWSVWVWACVSPRIGNDIMPLVTNWPPSAGCCKLWSSFSVTIGPLGNRCDVLLVIIFLSIMSHYSLHKFEIIYAKQPWEIHLLVSLNCFHLPFLESVYNKARIKEHRILLDSFYIHFMCCIMSISGEPSLKETSQTIYIFMCRKRIHTPYVELHYILLPSLVLKPISQSMLCNKRKWIIK